MEVDNSQHRSGDSDRSARREIGSILLASTDPEALQAWYERAFDVQANVDGFLPFGTVDLLITRRDDVAVVNAEPGRVINQHPRR